MGGLFSSPTPMPERKPDYVNEYNRAYSSPSPPPTTVRPPPRATTYSYQTVSSAWLPQNSVYEQRKPVPVPSPRNTIVIGSNETRKDYLLNHSKKFTNLQKNLLLILDVEHSSIDCNGPVKKTLSSDSPNYLEVLQSFRNTTRKYKIVKIEELHNPFLRLFYLLRMMEYNIVHGCDLKDQSWFHGTKRQNIYGIGMNNFNWRMHGKAKGNIFGKGVSFSPISDYAANYCDPDGTKLMILAESKLNRMCVGSKIMKIPPYVDGAKGTRYDTSGKPDGKVCVKYNDDEFYPRYIIHFVDK